MAVRRETYENKYYSYVRLCLEDLNEIEEVLHELGAEDNSFAVNSPDWTAPSLEEILAKDPSGAARGLEFRSYTPYVSVEIRRRLPARIYAADVNDLQVRGAVAKIDLIMRGSQRMTMLRLFVTPLGSATLGIVCGAGLLVEIAALRAHNVLLGNVGLITAVLASAAVVCASLPRWKGSMVHLVNRSDRTGFLRRNRDQLILAAIAAALGVLGTLLVVALT